MKYNQSSSGRWDASGSWEEAVSKQAEQALKWAVKLSNEDLSSLLVAMIDSNAFTTYERRAILMVASTRLPIPVIPECGDDQH